MLTAFSIAFDAGIGRFIAARLAGDRLLEGLEDLRLAAGLRDLVIEAPDERLGSPSRRQALGRRDAGIDHVAVGHFVDETPGPALFSAGTRSPETMSCSAASTPVRRGMR